MLPAIDGLTGGFQYQATYDIGLGPVTLTSGDQQTDGSKTSSFSLHSTR